MYWIIVSSCLYFPDTWCWLGILICLFPMFIDTVVAATYRSVTRHPSTIWNAHVITFYVFCYWVENVVFNLQWHYSLISFGHTLYLCNIICFENVSSLFLLYIFLKLLPSITFYSEFTFAKIGINSKSFKKRWRETHLECILTTLLFFFPSPFREGSFFECTLCFWQFCSDWVQQEIVSDT